MNRAGSPGDELDALIHAVCEGSVTSEQFARLEALILADPEAEARYIIAMNLEADLARAYGEAPRRAAPDPPASRPRRRRLGWRGVGASIGAAAALALAASLWLFLPAIRGPRAGRAPEVQSASTAAAEDTHDSIAVATQVLHASWDETGLAVRPGAPLPAGRLKLRSGLARVEFYCGAVVILEGPAELELISADRAFCHSGKLRAHVPRHARGFTIESPGVDLVDLGTEFGMTVGKRTEVRVFDGVVELQEYGPGRATPTRQRLTTGAALGIDESGARLPVEGPVRYVSPTELAARAAAESARKADEWRQASEALRNDPSLLAYYTFEPEDARRGWSHTLPDQALGGAAPNDATIIGCRWGTGRWAGKGALEFRRVSDRLRINIPGEFDSLTLMAWVRIDGLDNPFNSLLMSDSSNEGEIHWQIERSGIVKLGLQRTAGGKYPGPVVFQPDRKSQWVHLAVVYDQAGATVTHYVNAQPLASLPLRPRVKVRIHDAEIGNWTQGTAITHQAIRNFNGVIDDLAILSRPLIAQELVLYFTAGLPRN